MDSHVSLGLSGGTWCTMGLSFIQGVLRGPAGKRDACSYAAWHCLRPGIMNAAGRCGGRGFGKWRRWHGGVNKTVRVHRRLRVRAVDRRGRRVGWVLDLSCSRCLHGIKLPKEDLGADLLLLVCVQGLCHARGVGSRCMHEHVTQDRLTTER